MARKNRKDTASAPTDSDPSATLTITIKVDASQAARVFSGLIEVLAEELGAEKPAAEPGKDRQELSCTSVSTERRGAPHQEAPATPFGFGC